MTIKYIENKAKKIVLVDSLEWHEHGRVEVREGEAFYGIDLCSGITVRVLYKVCGITLVLPRMSS